MSNNLTFEEMLPIMTETLLAGGEVVFTPGGNSMLPMLHGGRDTVTLRKPDGTLKKYDLPLYRRKDGKFVLHRVIGFDNVGYLMRGDNTLAIETGITDSDIIGLVTKFTRNGKMVTCSSKGYRLYCRIWVFLHPVRYCLYFLKQLPSRILRKLNNLKSR